MRRTLALTVEENKSSKVPPHHSAKPQHNYQNSIVGNVGNRYQIKQSIVLQRYAMVQGGVFIKVNCNGVMREKQTPGRKKHYKDKERK